MRIPQASNQNSGNALRLERERERERESNTPLVSIVVPIYNVAPYLEQCLESIIGQSYDNLEIILVNDGSIDNSPAICEQYALQDKRIKLVHKPNGGLSSARNAGMQIMSGHLITFVDSDDYLEREMVERCVSKFVKYPKLDIVRFAWLEFDETGKTNLIYSLKTKDKLFSHQEAFELWMRAECCHSACTMMCRKQIIENLKFLEGVYAEDLEFNFQIFEHSQPSTLFIEEPLYHYRINSQGITQSKNNLMWHDACMHWINAIQNAKEKENKQRTQQTAYGLFLQLKILENRHRYWRTSGQTLQELQSLFAPAYQCLKDNRIDWSISANPIKDFLYWHCPRLWRLLRPRDWGVQSIRI